MKNIQCPQCNATAVKNGFQSGQQRYKCKSCNKIFPLNYHYNAYKANTNQMIVKLLKEGCGVRSISRILDISVGTVLSRMIKIEEDIEPPEFNQCNCVYEVDELWSFSGNKRNDTWIIYVLDRNTRKVVDFIVGRRTKVVIKKVIDTVLLLAPKRIYTDRLNIYPGLIPKEIHRVFQYWVMF